jgi:hypothetical protein
MAFRSNDWLRDSRLRYFSSQESVEAASLFDLKPDPAPDAPFDSGMDRVHLAFPCRQEN